MKRFLSLALLLSACAVDPTPAPDAHITLLPDSMADAGPAPDADPVVEYCADPGPDPTGGCCEAILCGMPVPASCRRAGVCIDYACPLADGSGTLQAGVCTPK